VGALIVVAMFSVEGYAAWIYGVKDYLLYDWVNKYAWTAAYKEVVLDLLGAVVVFLVAVGVVKIIM